MTRILFPLISLGCVATDLAIWAVDPHSISVAAAWICFATVVLVMVLLILETRRA